MSAQRKLILAEKPAVARDLARVLKVPLGGGAQGQGMYSGPGHVITWCIGHLIELEEPAAYQAAWKRWSWQGLPMLPESFQLRAIKGTARQWRVVRDLLRQRDFAAVINACDAGREGELIFRFCYELAGSRLPIERLWISSLTDQAIGQGLSQLRPGRDYDALADAARCRAESDWLVGMNATRAVTLQRRATQDVLCSIGRVQTPTLGLLVRREREIQNFVPRDYLLVHADLRTLSPAQSEHDEHDGRFRATWTYKKARRLAAEAMAAAVKDRSTAAAGRGEGPVVESVESRTVREPPPLLFDLTALQRTANRRFGFSAHRTLQIAQALYEQHKLITYPRTDSRYLTSDLVPQLGKLFQALGHEPAYAPLVAPLLGQPPAPPRRVFQDHKASDHHAIIPTQVPLTPAKLGALSGEERQLLDLIARRFIGAFYPDAEFQQTRVVVLVGKPGPRAGAAATEKEDQGGKDGKQAEREQASRREEILEAVPPPPDRYEARGRVRLRAGWQEVAGFGAREQAQGPRPGGAADKEREDEGQEDPAQALPALSVGQRLAGEFVVEARQTQPPPRYTEATLLGAMESAGQHLTSEELQKEMKDVGLGTPATRAAIIETLLTRTYIERRGKILWPTPLGIDLVERLPVLSLASPELTGQWEARLARIARGEDSRAAFMGDIARYVREIVDAVRAAPAPAAVPLEVAQAPPRGAQQGGKSRPARRPAAAKPTRAAPKKRGSGPRSTLAVGPVGEGTAGPAAPRPTRRSASTKAGPAPPFARDPAPRVGRVDTGVSRSSLAAEVGAVGTPVLPELRCPRCLTGRLLVGRRGWGCSRWQDGCPLVIPFQVLGRRLLDTDLRDIIDHGASAPLQFQPGGQGQVKARLRLAPQGSPAGFVYLEPV